MFQCCFLFGFAFLKDFQMLCVNNIMTTFSTPTKTGVLSILTPFAHLDKHQWPWSTGRNFCCFSDLWVWISSGFPTAVIGTGWTNRTEQGEAKGVRDAALARGGSWLLLPPYGWFLRPFPVPDGAEAKGLGQAGTRRWQRSIAKEPSVMTT